MLKLTIVTPIVLDVLVYDRFDTVAGLVPRSVAPPGSTVPRLLPCIGDEEIMNEVDGVMSLPATPRLATPCTLKMGNCQLYMPNRRAVEIKMCEEYASMLQMKDASKVLVVSRKLRIGASVFMDVTLVIFHAQSWLLEVSFAPTKQQETL